MKEFIKKQLNNIVHYIICAIKMFRFENIMLLPAHVAFFTLWSVVPILILWTSVLKFFPELENVPVVLNFDFVPDLNKLTQLEFNFDMQSIILITIVLYLSSKAFLAIINTSNYVYGISSNSNYFKKKFKSMIFSVLAISTMIALLMLSLFGREFFDLVQNRYFSDFVITFVDVLKTPISIMFLFIVVYIVYSFAPSEHIKLKYFLPGTIFTTLGWVLSSSCYFYYVNEFADYSKVYTNFANLIVLMIWIYLLSYILIIGLVINATYFEERRNVEIRKTSRRL